MPISQDHSIKNLITCLVSVFFLLIAGCSDSNHNKNPSDLVPEGYIIFEKVHGDLNKDGINDSIFIVKSTDKEGYVVDEYRGELDRNRRGIMIFLNRNDRWELATQNLSCFSSENQDGGVYMPPELYVNVEGGNLNLHYGNGRYGYWKYTFNFRDSDLDLIEYESSDNHGPIIKRETSMNFLTKRKLERVNINKNSKHDGDGVFEETWTDIKINKLIRLSIIEDFDKLDLQQFLIDN